MRLMPRCAGTGRKTRLPGPSSSPLGAAGGLDFIGPKFAESSPLTVDQDLSTDAGAECCSGTPQAHVAIILC